MTTFKRIISVILVIAISIPLFTVSVGAASASGSDLRYDLESVEAMNLWFDNSLVINPDVANARSLYWTMINKITDVIGYGSCPSLDVLTKCASQWNAECRKAENWPAYAAYGFMLAHYDTGPFVMVEYDSNARVYRLREQISGVWLTSKSGLYPYYKPADDFDGGGAGFTEQLSYQWLRTNQVNWNGGIAIVSYMELKEILALGYDGYIERRGNYLHIFDRATDGTKILCSEEGFPLSAISDMSSTAVGTPNNYYTEEGDTINNYDQGDTIYNEFLDITNNTTWFPNGTLQYIDKVVYDESTKTYIVDSHDSYTYNSTTNNYVTNNYRYEYNYHIDYTSVTYIGTTEQYDEEYRYYYQLPDGRSSADLTAEDLEQLSIAFTDVVNYARSADDANMRVLYHFDGNTQDSSYWSYCTDFTWNSGASLTYMDEGTFGGSLYLDETEHDFTITLPNGMDGLNDFTLQFRYYQSYTAAPATDSYIKLGDNVVFRFTGTKYMTGDFNTESFAATSIGTWNEIALMSYNGVLYYFINGVPSAYSTNCSFSGGTITFHFGASQQTYKKLDELRFSRGAIYSHVGNYEPTSVPYDTNLTLILPDGERPIADEILVLHPSENNMLDASGLSDWSSIDITSSLYGCDGLYKSARLWIPSNGTPAIGYDSSKLSFNQSVGSVLVNFGGINYQSTFSLNSNTYYKPNNALFFPLVASYYDSQAKVVYGMDALTDYTLTVVLSDGTYSSITFSLASLRVNTTVTKSVGKYSDINFDIGKVGPISNNNAGNEGSYALGIYIYSDTSSTEIAYMELVEGSVPQFDISYEMAMYSSGELEDSPVLAVRSNQPITAYQIGGVRPSYPQKGQVWAMVENGRITSLQQYSGSAWVEVDGRIWTGQRWIPYSSFDVFLLKDCFDIQGTVTGDDYEYIYSESGFWAWFQKQWLAFMVKIDQILDAVQKISGTGGSDLEDEQTFPDAADPDGDGSSWGIVDLLVSVKDGVWHFVTGVVSAGFDGFTEFTVSIVRIGDLFDSFDEDNENGIFIPVEEGGSVWD